jgi:hypothetical protein
MSEFIKFCKTQINPFMSDEKELPLWKAFGKYLSSLDSKLDHKKGVLVRGVVGAGKTIMFKMAQRYKKGCFKMVNVGKVEIDLENGESYSKYCKAEWCFDDLGSEQMVNNYGKAVEVFKRLIEIRYDLWKYHGVRTHFTTNLSNEEIKTRYGERAYERLKEMCNVVLYPSPNSKRGKSQVKIVETVFEISEKEILTSKEIELRNKQAIINNICGFYASYLAGERFGKCFLLPESYEKLDQIGLITATTKEKLQAMEEAKKKLKEKAMYTNLSQVAAVRNKLADKDVKGFAKRLIVWKECEKWESELYSEEVLRGILDKRL